MKDAILMYVRGFHVCGVELAEVGGIWETDISINTPDIPGDILRSLVGRQVWITGGYQGGDPCKILEWVTPPKHPSPTPTGEGGE